MTSAQNIFLTFEQYLELESLSEVRHEFVGGRMFAMVGASDAHNVLTGAIHVLVYNLAEKNGCQAYVSDTKLKIDQSIYYPDVMVTCEPYSAKSLYKQSPCVLVEVLSPGTADVDRREKLAAYKQIPSLTDYLVVYCVFR